MIRSFSQICIYTVLSVLIFLSSCSQKKDTIENKIIFTSYALDTIKPFMKDSLEPNFHYAVNIEYPEFYENEIVLNKINNFIITSVFGESFSGKSFENATKEDLKNCFDDYLSLREELPEDFYNSASLNFYLFRSAEITCNANNILSFNFDTESYSGGAHGMYSRNGASLNLKTGEPIYLEDLFSEDSLDKLSDLIIYKITKNAGVANPMQLNEEGYFSAEEIRPTENFEIMEDGIQWIYNPYEIACYAVGRVEVKLTWDELSPYISDDSPISSFI